MIYEIHESLLAAIDDGNQEALNFLSGLADGRRRGKLSIFASKKVCLSIIENEHIEEQARSVFKKENNDLTFNREILVNVSRRLICFHSKFHDALLVNDDCCLFDVSEYHPYDEKFNSIFDQVKLYVEDLITDGKVFKIIHNHFSNKLPLANYFGVNIEMLHGGGDRITELYKECDYDKRNVFAIVDSDKKSPESVLGGTSRKLSLAFNDFNKKNNLLVGRFHEIENLIPLSTYRKIAKPTQIEALDFLEHSSNMLSETYLYYDFKNSFTYGSIFNSENEIATYWKPIFTSYTCEKLKRKIEEEKADNKLLNKLGVIVPYCISDLEKSPPNEIENMALNEAWKTIGKWLFDIGICSKSISV